MPNDCLFCGRIFSTPQGLGQHRRHGCKNGPKAAQEPPVSPSNSSDLLSCPFCSGKAKVLANGGARWVRCQKCGASTEESHTELVAISFWNKRAI